MVAEDLDVDCKAIPRSISAQVSRTVRRLAAKNALVCEYSPKGQVTKIRLTKDGIVQHRYPQILLVDCLRGLRHFYPTTRQMAAAIGKSVGTVSRWENWKSLPDDFQGTIAQLVLLIEQAKEDQKEERRRVYMPVSKEW